MYYQNVTFGNDNIVFIYVEQMSEHTLLLRESREKTARIFPFVSVQLAQVISHFDITT